MKNFVKFFVGGLISLLLVVLLSCGEDAGLGSTVDTEAPKLSISYPPAAAYVRGEFVFAGTCSDDKGVTRVEVNVKNLDTGKTYDTVLAKIENSLTWSININKQTASGFELSDGKYMLEVTAYDKSGRSSGTSSRQFDIDNTPPVFVITKPGVNRKVYLSENSISKYGSLFSIEGTIADDHSIASMDVTIYDKDGNPVASEPYSEKEISTTGGTSVTIARFIENGVDASNLRYNEIYSVGDADASGNKVYSCTVTVADSTKEYKNPGDNGTEGGNSTSVVYLYDDVYDEYMSAKKGAGLSANDFRSVLNGTATNESLSGKGIATDVTVEKVLAALKNFAKDTTNIEDNSLSFSLNPNADPTYNISGFNLNYNEAGTAIAAGTNKAMGEQPLTVIVSQGLDNVPIVPKSLKIYIKKIIEADKAHITKNALNKSISDLVTKVSELEIDLANASESLDTEKQKEAEAQLSVIDGWNLLLDNSEDNSPSEATYTLSLTLPANNYIEANAYYAIVVTGNDKDGIKLSQTKNFGFMGTISAVPPSASFLSPADNQFFANSKAETLSFTGTATENNAGMTLRKITAILTASDESTGKEVDGKVEVTIEGNSDKIWGNVPGLSCYYDEAEKTNKWTFTPALCNGYDTLKAEDEGLQYAYKATIKVTGTGELTTETSRSIKIDTKKPVVAITSVTPVVSGKEYFGEDSQYKDYTFINSTISIQGSITENNLSSVTYDVRASADLNADLSDEKYSILAGLKEFSEKNGEIVVNGDLGRISSIEQKFHTDLITNYLIASKQISKDQPVKARIVLRAKDLVGNVGEYNSSESNEGKDFFVYQETDRPKVTLGNSELSYKVGDATKSLLVDEKDENKDNINYEHNLFGTTNNNKLSLSFTDDDSVVEYDIFIAKNGEDFAKDEKGNEKPNYIATPNKTSASVNFVLPEEEGVYKVKVVARDFIRSDTKTDATQVYGVQVIGPFYIAVDSGAPTLNLSNPQNGGFVSRANGVDEGVKGTVTKREGTTISGFIYAANDTTKKHLIELTDVKINDKLVNGVYEWTGKISEMPATGDNFKFEINAKDVYEQSSTIIVNLGIDEKAPTVKVTLDEDENFTKNKQILETNSNYSVKAGKKRYLVNGTWGDSYTDDNNAEVKGTGTKDLYYAVATTVDASGEPVWGEAQKVAGTAESTAETSFNIYLELTNIEGSNFAYKVWGKDKAGNESKPNEADGTLVKGITVDLSVPTIEKTSGAVPQYIKKDGTLTISGQAEDSYGLKEITAKVKLNGAYIAIGENGYTENGCTFTPVIAEDKKSGTFTIQLVADDENNGAWTFEIYAVDLADRKSGTLNYNTVVDTKKPVWNADSFQVNKTAYVSGTNHTWYKASSLPFAGAYTEAGSGIEHVDYTVIKAGETTGTTETFGTTKVTDASGNFTGEESFSANLGEFERKVDASGTVPNIVEFVAVDKAGNESEKITVQIYIDTEAPSLESHLTGSQYSNQTTPFEFTGTASDDSSGIAGVELKVYEDGNPVAIPDPNDPDNREKDAIKAIGTGAAGENDYSSWAATIPVTRLQVLASKPHSVKATVTDVAGNKTTLTIFKINVDKDKPTISNISFTNTSEKYSVYQTEETVTGSTEKIATYYMHNNDGNKFSIYGSIMDQTSGIKKIELLEGTVSIIPESVASLPITNIDFAGREGSANLTLKATDNAGNVTEFPLVVVFDNTPPMGIHAIDKSNKDIFFRISDLNNWKWDGTEGEIENWDASLDEDIGGKYSPTSYGKNQTVRVRGNISDKESGVDMIYYKVISAGTDEMAQADATVDGKLVKGLVNIAKEFLENYKNDNNGYFRANKIEEKRITYTSIGEADKVYDTNGNLVVLRGTDETKNDGTDTIFEGLVKNFGACHGQESVNDSPKHYATVTTNYDNSFTGFKDGYNYLILVAVDNVGNASLDTVNVVYGDTTTQYNNFSLNVDTVTPELQSKQSGQLLTNGSDDLPLNGTFTDNFAGVKTIVLDLINTSTKNTVKTFTLDSSSESSDPDNPNKGFFTTSGTWGKTISQNDLTALDTAVYSVKATVTDRAGNQWPQNIFTIQKDATPPEITNVKLTQQSSTYKIYKPNENVDEYYVNPSDGKFTIEGGATDNYGIKKIELVIPGYSGTITPVEDKGSFEFKELDLSTLTGDEVTVTLKVTDTAGNTLATDKTIKLVFDKTSPSWNADEFKINERAFDSGTDAKNWFKDSLLTFAGSYTEAGAGIEKVIYEITKAGGEGTLPQGSFATTALTGTDAGKETFTSNLSGFVQKTGDTGDDYNIVKLWAVDKVGNKNSTPMEFLIYIDTEAPKVTSNNSEILYTNGEGKLKKITGTVTDNAAGISSVKLSANGKELTEDSTTNGTLSITKTDSKNWTWEAEVNGEVFKESNGKVKDGNLTISAIVVDTSGNDRSVAVANIIVDGTNPTVTLTALTDANPDDTSGTHINGKISLKGTISDGNVLPATAITGIQYVAAPLDNSNKPKKFADLIDTEKNALSWTTLTETSKGEMSELAFDGNYTFTVSGFDTTKLTDETTYYLRAVATDWAKNEGLSNVQTVIVSQDSDRPMVKITNLNYSKTLEKYLLKYGTNSQVTGRITDDDSELKTDDDPNASKVIKTFIVSETEYTGTGAEPTNLLGDATAVAKVLSSGEFTISPSNPEDGVKTFYIYIEDKGGKKYWTTYTSVPQTTTNDNLQNPKIYINGARPTKKVTENETVIDESVNSSVFSYLSDSKQPVGVEGKIVAYNDDTDKTVAKDSENEDFSFDKTNSVMNTSLIIGGSKRKFAKFRFKGNDSSGVAGIYVQFSYTEGTTEKVIKLGGTDDSPLTKLSTATKIGDETISGCVVDVGTDKGGEFSDSNNGNTDAVWTTDYIDVSSWPTEIITAKLCIYDKVGLSSTPSYSFKVDNTPPAISVIEPLPNEQVTGDVTISGSASDIDSGTDTIEWVIPVNGTVSEWHSNKVNGSTATSWKFLFDGEQANNPKLDDYDSLKYATTIEDGVYTLPIYFRAADKIGNTSTLTTYKIRHDPDGDRPRLSFTYPKTSDYDKDADNKSLGYVTLGGVIRVSGNARIPKDDSETPATVEKVYFQLGQESKDQNNNDTTFTSNTAKAYVSSLKNGTGESAPAVYTVKTLADIIGTEKYNALIAATGDTLSGLLKNYGFASIAEATSWWGIEANGSASWNFTLNEQDELNIEGETNNIKLRACGLNSKGKFGPWTTGDDIISIRIDSAAPEISGTVNKYASLPTTANAASTAAQAYEADMFLHDQWYLAVTITDDGGLKNDNPVNVESTAGSLTDGTDYKIVRVSDNQYQAYIKLSTVSGEKSYTIKATDKDNKTSKRTFSFRIDNAAPTWSNLQNGTGKALTERTGSNDYERRNTISNDNYVYIIKGSSNDGADGSGVKHVVFYYMRNAGVTKASLTNGNVVLDPMIKPTGTDYSAGNIAIGGTGGLETLTLTQPKESGSGNDEYSLYAKKLSVAKNAVTTSTVSGTFDDAHIRVGGLITFDKVIFRKITKKEAGKITFEPELTSVPTADNVDVWFPIAQVIDSTKAAVNNSDNPFTFAGYSADETDGMPESFTGTTPKWDWSATIHSENLPDGPVSLVILVFDNAGNVTGKTFNAMVSNNAPRLARIHLGTDLNKSDSYTDNEFESYNILASTGNSEGEELFNLTTAGFNEYTWNSTSEKWTKATETSKRGSFKIKNKLAVIPEFVGGNGAINIVFNNADSGDYQIDTGKKDEQDNSIYTVKDSHQISTSLPQTKGDYTGTFENKAVTAKPYWEFTTLGNDTVTNGDVSTKRMSFTFWDSTDECTSGTDSQYAFLRVMDFIVAQNDSTPPNVVVSKFDWKQAGSGTYIDSETRNDVYKNNIFYDDSKPLGHIELEDDWTHATGYVYTDTSGEYDGDPKVSGKIIIRGTAYDDSFLYNLSFTMTNFNLSTGANPQPQSCEIATYDKINSKWVPATAKITASPRYEVLSVEDEYFNQDGHKVKWEVAIDTAYLSDVAHVDANFNVVALDYKADNAHNSSDSEANTATADGTTDATKHVPSYQMDVVPYITEIKNLFTENAPEVARSAKGYYSVYDGEQITITGFNLTAPALSLNGESTTIVVNSFDKENIVATVKSTKSVTATTGGVVVTVNEIESLNNKNLNPTFAAGASEATSGSKAMYNSLANSTNNKRLTDDAKLYVWNKGFFIANTYVTDPAMKMTANGNFYMVYDGNAGDNGAYQLKMNANAFVGANGKKSGSTGTIKNADGSYSNFHKNAVAVDADGNFYGASTNTDRVSNTSARFKYYLWTSAQTDEYDSDYYRNYDGRKTGYSLEQVYNDETKKYDRERVAIPKMFAHKVGNNSRSYMSYFDGNHTQKPVKFRCTVTGISNAKDGLKQDSNMPYDYSKKQYIIAQSGSDVNTSTGSAKYFHVIADSSGAKDNSGNPIFKYTGGKYTAVGATRGGVAVVAWYELSQDRLIFSYNENPDIPVYGGAWQTNAQPIDAGGQYVDLFVDSKDGIHIAYQSGASLKYAYLPTYDSKINPKNVVTVDAYGTTGTYITINTKDETVTENNTTTTYIVPYISYQSATYAETPRAVRIAWMPKAIAKGTGTTNTADTTGNGTAVVKAGTSGNFFTENWEVIAVPTVADTKAAIVYSGLPTSGNRWRTDANSAFSPVLGYMTSSGFESAYIQY